MNEYEILVCYNRESNSDKDFYKTIIVKAKSYENACMLVNNYEIENMFDAIENDYLEDSLYSVRK